MVPTAVNTPPQLARRSASRAVGRVEGLGQPPVVVDQEAVEAEYLHFLGGLDAGRGLAHIVEFATLRRVGEVERIGLRVEMRLAQEHRHQRHQQQDDQPGREDHQAGGEAQHRHDVLRLVEQLRHQRDPPGGLPARAFELVLELRVLEIREVEGLGVLHEVDARFVRQAVRQQAVDQHHDPADDVGEDGERELGQGSA